MLLKRQVLTFSWFINSLDRTKSKFVIHLNQSDVDWWITNTRWENELQICIRAGQPLCDTYICYMYACALSETCLEDILLTSNIKITFNSWPTTDECITSCQWMQFIIRASWSQSLSKYCMLHALTLLVACLEDIQLYEFPCSLIDQLELNVFLLLIRILILLLILQ